MPALYSITSRADGTTLTSVIYNADHQNHVNNGDATQLGGYSTTAGQMQSATDPGQVGTESLATAISDELARLRFVLARLQGQAQWYPTPISTVDVLTLRMLS